MPGKTYQFGDTVYDLIVKLIKDSIVGFSSGGRLNLGGGEGDDGGEGGPPAPFIGQLKQTDVAFDTTEAATPENYGVTREDWTNSLLDNLNHIRYWQLNARWFEPVFDDTYNVDIREGRWWRGQNTFLDFQGGEVTIAVPDVAYPRIDVIYVDSTGTPGVSQGVAETNPEPLYPDVASMVICEVYVKPSGYAGVTIDGIGYTYASGYAQGYLIRDLRPFIGANFDQEIAGAQYLGDLLDVSSAATTSPTHRDVLTYDNFYHLWRPLQWMMGGIGGGHPTLQIDGPLTLLTSVGGAYIFTRSGEVAKVYMYCENPGLAGTTIIDANINGITIFPNQTKRPQLAWSDPNQVAVSVTLSGAVFVAEDILTIDIDQIASGVAGLTVVAALEIPTTHPHSYGPHTGVLVLPELQDGAISGYPLLSDGNYPDGGPYYGKLSTVGMHDDAVTYAKAGPGVWKSPYRRGGGADWVTAGTTWYSLTGTNLIMQCGVEAIYGLTTNTITFNQAFSAAPIVFTQVYPGTDQGSVVSISASQVQIRNGNTGGYQNYFWMAIGPE